jgi:hypothetical protein
MNIEEVNGLEVEAEATLTTRKGVDITLLQGAEVGRTAAAIQGRGLEAAATVEIVMIGIPDQDQCRQCCISTR